MVFNWRTMRPTDEFDWGPMIRSIWLGIRKDCLKTEYEMKGATLKSNYYLIFYSNPFKFGICILIYISKCKSWKKVHNSIVLNNRRKYIFKLKKLTVFFFIFQADSIGTDWIWDWSSRPEIQPQGWVRIWFLHNLFTMSK